MKKMKLGSKSIGLQNEPEYEQEVVFLFSRLYKELGFTKIYQMRPQFPDCYAYHKKDGRVGIEFELYSHGFIEHATRHEKCDYVICWEHDWLHIRRKVKVIQLRDYFELPKKIWICPSKPEHISDSPSGGWTVKMGTHKNDLLLIYYSSPVKAVDRILLVRSDPYIDKAGDWKEGDDLFADTRLFCKLKKPITISDLKKHPMLKKSGFVKLGIVKRMEITSDWSFISRLIIKKNPKLKSVLKQYME